MHFCIYIYIYIYIRVYIQYIVVNNIPNAHSRVVLYWYRFTSTTYVLCISFTCTRILYRTCVRYEFAYVLYMYCNVMCTVDILIRTSPSTIQMFVFHYTREQPLFSWRTFTKLQHIYSKEASTLRWGIGNVTRSGRYICIIRTAICSWQQLYQSIRYGNGLFCCG